MNTPAPQEKIVRLIQEVYSLPMDAVGARESLLWQLATLAKQQPSDPRVRLTYAVALFHNGYREKGVTQLDSAYSLRNDLDPFQFENLVRALAMAGDLVRARSALWEIDDFPRIGAEPSLGKYAAASALLCGDVEYIRQLADHTAENSFSNSLVQLIDECGLAESLPTYADVLVQCVGPYACNICAMPEEWDPSGGVASIIFEVWMPLPFAERRELQRGFAFTLREKLRDVPAAIEAIDQHMNLICSELPAFGASKAAA